VASEKSNQEEPLPPPTAPQFSVTCNGIEEEVAQRFLPIIGQYIIEISRYIDLERLDGVTVAADYPAALAELDRGYETRHVLTPTSEFGIGVAMTPAVIRDGAIKSHIVLNATFILPLEDDHHEYWSEALHILAHECAHVAVTKGIDTAFPGMLLRHRYDDVGDTFRWQIIDACFDEYGASRLSAVMGSDRTLAYEETFVLALRETRDRADSHIRDYRLHGDVDRVLAEVSGQYGTLMKFASYLIGHLHGAQLPRNGATAALAALRGHWFAPYFDRLEAALENIWSRFCIWESRDEFLPIGEIAHDVIADGGVQLIRQPDGRIYVNVPYTPHTMPQ
jgi:hypothetical protein